MKATRDGFGEQLVLSASANEKIIGLSADLGKATRISQFADSYPDRFFQVGIAENNMIGIASGLSEHGYKVFLTSFASLLTGKYDTIRCSIAYSNVPCVIVGTHSGMAIGRDGVTQMGLEDLSLMGSLPGMVVLNPSTYNQTKAVVRYLCDAELTSPHYLRLGRQPVEEFYRDGRSFNIDDAIVHKTGSLGVVCSTGCVLQSVMEATKNIDIGVVDFPTVKPLDIATIIDQAGPLVVTVEDHSIIGGLGSGVAVAIAEHNVASRLCRIGLNDIFPESGKPDDLYEKYGLSARKIEQRILNELDK